MKQTEHQEQATLIKWFRYQYPIYAKCLWAIPNGGMRHIRTAIKLKKEGVLPGVADLFLMIPREDKHGLFIEMKAKNGKIQPSQKEFLQMAKAMGYEIALCYGFEDAKQFITSYLNKKGFFNSKTILK